MNLPFYIARRYLFSRKKHNAINIISAVSVCGVALATLALICTLSVFNGFQDMVAGFFTAFDPELKITIREGKVFDGQDARIQSLRSLPEVAVFTQTLEENAMVQYKDRQTMAVLKGVEDNFEDLTEID
ncbi:MAG: ABC transporter permease, partial [Bacteroides sp.]